MNYYPFPHYSAVKPYRNFRILHIYDYEFGWKKRMNSFPFLNIRQAAGDDQYHVLSQFPKKWK